LGIIINKFKNLIFKKKLPYRKQAYLICSEAKGRIVSQEYLEVFRGLRNLSTRAFIGQGHYIFLTQLLLFNQAIISFF
jgi:hypothetical protein